MILGSWAERICPNWGLFLAVVTVTNPGAPARKLLVRLNASPRTSMVFPSVMWKMRDNAASICQKPGPGIFERPRLPSAPVAGCANAAGLIQQAGRGLSHNGFARI